MDGLIEQIFQIVYEESDGHAPATITAESRWSEMGLDSITNMTIVARLEDAHRVLIPDQRLATVYTVADLASLVMELIADKAGE